MVREAYLEQARHQAGCDKGCNGRRNGGRLGVKFGVKTLLTLTGYIKTKVKNKLHCNPELNMGLVFVQ